MRLAIPVEKTAKIIDFRHRRHQAPALPEEAAQHASRLRICFISETMHAGVGRHIVDAISGLAERGHEIHLLYSPIRLQPEFLATIKEQRNVHCEAIAMPRAIGAGDFAVVRRIRRYLVGEGPFDVIHGHSSKGGGYARMMRLYGLGPIVYTPHAFITMSPLKRGAKQHLYRALEARLARWGDRIICCSQFEREHAQQLGIAAHRLSIITHGASRLAAEPRARLRDRLGLGTEHVVVGFVGRMDEQKAPEYLVAAAEQLLPELPQLVFLFIGDGPKRASLEARLQRAGLGGRTRWLGAVEARPYMPAFDMLALSSLYEGFPYVLIEALFAGLPIVSTPVGGTREAIADGVNGMIVAPASADALAAAIRKLAADPGLRRAMAAASLARAENFTVRRMIGAMEDLYFTVRAETRRPAPSARKAW